MTNFQQDAQKGRFSWLTPERALVLIPVGVGGVLALILGGALVARFLNDINNLTILEKERLQKQEELPFLKVQERKLKENYVNARTHTKILESLVAGNQSIETLLSQLNMEALQSDVELESYEPQRKSQSPSANESNPNNDSSATDSLISEGVTTETRLLVTRGPYQGQLEFLRRLERITPLLIISDLSLQADSLGSTTSELEDEATNTMRLTITAYVKKLAKN